MMENAIQLIGQYACGKRVALAVSGGEDSMALLHVFLSCAKEYRITLFVVNVNHGIRKNAAHDSEFVENYCKERGVEFFGACVDIPARCKQSGRGEECEAHFARKEIFAELLQAGRADMVVTAHHMRDNAETVLLHLFRGCGLKGLSGMDVLSREGIFRPFLRTPKEEICAYVQANAIVYVEDETNADSDYDRNYVRHEILPRIRDRFPAAERAICRTAGFAREAAKAVDEGLRRDAFCVQDGAVSLGEDYLSAPYIFAALEKLGKTTDVYATAVERVQMLKDCKPCARADLGDGIVAAREYGAVTFYRARESAQLAVPFAAENFPQRIAAFDGLILVVDFAAPPYFPKAKDTLVFCADCLPQDCVWRTRREGDRFTPYGGGTRKLKEYFIDKKVPRRLRDSVPLLCCGDRVLVIAGREISDDVKVTKDSKRVLSLRAIAYPEEND